MSARASQALEGFTLNPKGTGNVLVRDHYGEGDLMVWKKRLAKAREGDIVSFTELTMVDGPGNGWSLAVETADESFKRNPARRQFANVTTADRKATRIILQSEYEGEMRTGKITPTRVIDEVHNLHPSMAPVAERSLIRKIEAVIQGY